jgi:hypothetical protein
VKNSTVAPAAGLSSCLQLPHDLGQIPRLIDMPKKSSHFPPPASKANSAPPSANFSACSPDRSPAAGFLKTHHRGLVLKYVVLVPHHFSHFAFGPRPCEGVWPSEALYVSHASSLADRSTNP